MTDLHLITFIPNHLPHFHIAVSSLGGRHLDSNNSYTFSIPLSSQEGNKSEIKTIFWYKGTPLRPCGVLKDRCRAQSPH